MRRAACIAAGQCRLGAFSKQARNGTAPLRRSWHQKPIRTAKTPFALTDSLYGDAGTDPSTAPFGNTNSGGLYGQGRYGYSINTTASAIASVTTASADRSDVNFNSLFTASLDAEAIVVCPIPLADIDPNYDPEAIRSFYLEGANAPTVAQQFPQFTKIVGTNLQLIVESGSWDPAAATSISYSLKTLDNERGDFEDGNDNLNGNNDPITIPEINVQMQSSAIVAKTRKLKAVWTPEFAQDLNAYHALDAEAELTSILSEYISLEIDMEILDMLQESAAAGTEVWSAVNNQAIVDNGTNGTFSDLGFYNSQGQWFQTLGTKIQKLSNIIHQKTLRGGANFMVISPTIGTILESIPGYAADADGDVSKSTYAFGVQKVGAFNGRYKVYKNPYMTENQILLGFRGAQFLETGAVFAPYIPLIMTPLIYDPSTFTPRKGLMTRYAKKMVRPEFYGLIKVAGLETL